MTQALVFTRTKHRADRLAEYLGAGTASTSSASTATGRRRSAPQRSPASRAASIRCSSRPISPRAASTSTALGHVVNFDVPAGAGRLHPPCRPHRPRRSRPATAFTFVAPEEEGSLRDIERAIGKRLPRVTVPDFDYTARPQTRLEVPHRRSASRRFARARRRARAGGGQCRAARRGGPAAEAARRSTAPATAGRGRPPSGGRPPQPSGGRPALSAAAVLRSHGSARPRREAAHAQHRPGGGRPGRGRG